MTYLKRELEEFARTREEFTAAYTRTLQSMHRIFVERGAVRDETTPVHHRMAPTDQLGVVKAKISRLKSYLAQPAWERDAGLVGEVLEEALDAANYLVYIAALCSMLLEEGKVPEDGSE